MTVRTLLECNMAISYDHAGRPVDCFFPRAFSRIDGPSRAPTKGSSPRASCAAPTGLLLFAHCMPQKPPRVSTQWMPHWPALVPQGDLRGPNPEITRPFWILYDAVTDMIRTRSTGWTEQEN